MKHTKRIKHKMVFCCYKKSEKAKGYNDLENSWPVKKFVGYIE